MEPLGECCEAYKSTDHPLPFHTCPNSPAPALVFFVIHQPVRLVVHVP